MKKTILLSAIILVNFLGQAQKPFEGKITYNIEITGEGSDAMSAFMIKGYEYYFSENNVRLEMKGGMAYMFGYFIINDVTKKSYMVSDEDYVAYEMNDSDDSVNDSSSFKLPQIVKLNGTEKVLGYTCSKYQITTVEDSTTIVMEYWVTSDIVIGNRKNLGSGNSLFVEGISGFPLKIISDFDGMQMTQTATEIKAEKLDKALFEVPKGYKIKNFSESPLGQFGQ